MKFISKLWRLFLLKMYHLPILIFTSLYKIYSFLYKKYLTKKETNIQNNKWWIHRSTNRKFFKFSDSQIWKRIYCKDVPIFFLYCSKYFGDSWEVRGSRLWPNLRSSQNHLKSIGICPGTFISHFGIITTQKKTK